jgi:Uma2 family endonuclease
MRTLVCDPPPADLEAFLERRKKLGQDRHDEVWEGVLHIMPFASGEHSYIAHQLAVIFGPLARAAGLWPTVEFNLGDSKDDYRVPDGGLHRTRPRGVWIHTAAMVIEILSPGDETWEKLPFYAAHHVDEVLIVDPDTRTITWLALTDAGTDAGAEGGGTDGEGGEALYEPIEHSRLIELGAAGLSEQIDWP